MKTFKLSLLVALFAFAGNAVAAATAAGNGEGDKKGAADADAAKKAADKAKADADKKSEADKAKARRAELAGKKELTAEEKTEKAKLDKEATDAMTSDVLAGLENDAAKAGSDAKTAYENGLKDATRFTRFKAAMRNHWKCYTGTTAAFVAVGAVAYYFGKNAKDAEVEEQLPA